MSIQELGQKIKQNLDMWLKNWGLPVCILLVGLSAFGLGRISAIQASQTPISITEAPVKPVIAPLAQGGEFIGDKAHEAYYFPWCPAVAKIPTGNSIWFATEAAAKQAGYLPGKNCQGLEQ